MTEVKSLEEAASFFLKNHSDSCLCVKGEEKLQTYSYPDAVKFFNQNL